MDQLVLLLDDVLELRSLADVGGLQVGHLLLDHPEVLLPAVHLLLLHLPPHRLHPSLEETPQFAVNHLLLESRNHRYRLGHRLLLQVVVPIQRTLQLIERTLLHGKSGSGEFMAGLG
jgi:hypothetical protein